MRTALPLVLLLTACPEPSRDAERAAEALDAAAETITPEDAYVRIAFLASDALEGRDTPSPGLELAASYIADELDLFGLEPAGEDGWLQRFPLAGADSAELDPPNVVGLLRGQDPELRDTYVVVSAHMDGVGIGRPVDGDSIYNGADDDASGTAAVIEIAEAFASLPFAPKRSILFLTVSGEEKGLLGSRWFSEHPTVPIESIVANMNIDMIGRNAPDTIVVIGQEYSSLGPLAEQVAADNPELALTVAPDPWPEERFFFRSDHFNFARKEIPALFFFAGTHEDYHGPDDEVDEIDADKVARVARLVFRLTYEIAQAEEPPVWTTAGLAEVRRLTGGGQ